LNQSYVLDTNILLYLVRGSSTGASIDRAYGLRSSLQRHIISIASQAELYVLADRYKWGATKREALRLMLDNVVIVPIDGQGLVDAYVRIAAAASSWPEGPRNMGKNDIWIAATSLYAGVPLLTADKDYLFLNNNPIQVIRIDPATV
jgi:tRNA(fMet)-specific endonuclease VapC